MPDPVSRYHIPVPLLVSIPDIFHSSLSALCVPELSPRDAKGVCWDAIEFRASETSVDPVIFAGSSEGPTITKSLNMRSKRFTVSVADELFFSSLRVNQKNVTVASLCILDCLTSPYSHHVYCDSGILLDHWKDVIVKARVFC